MRNKRNKPSENQLELQFDCLVSTQEISPSVESNVVHVQFGMPKPAPMSGSKDKALIERILQSAQRLKW